MITKITAVRYQCKCDHRECKHKWESDSVPERCAKCKKTTWNRPAMVHGRGGKLLKAFGESKTVTQWAKDYKMTKSLITWRMNRGMKLEEALTAPVREYKKD